MHHTARGLTLMELLLVMLLMGIMTSLAMPGFLAFNQQNARAAAVNQLQSTLAFARNTAITQRMEMTVCPADATQQNCTNAWSGPILVVAGDRQDNITSTEIVRIFPSPQNADIAYSRGWRRIKFTALGHTSGYNGRFFICPGSAEQGSELFLSQLGRLRIGKQPLDCST